MKRTAHKVIFLLTALLASLPVDVMACPACFGGADDPITKSIGWGILFLLGVVGAVLGTIVGFFFYIVRRAAAVNAASPALGVSTTVAGKA